VHIAAATVAMISSEAMAWSHGSSGSTGSSGSYGSGGSYGSSASYGSSGSREGVFARMRSNRAERREASSSHGSYGSYGSSGSYGSWGGATYSAPVEVPAEAPATDESASHNSDSVTITVSLPPEAKVFVNDQATTSTGSSRNYVSRDLEAGVVYDYKLRVEFEQDGKKVVENKLLKLRAGDNLDVNFGNEGLSQLTSSETKVETELKLEVPENAKVFLAGAASEQTGSTRSYITRHLVAGEAWAGYTVRVELDRDGVKLVQNRNLTVVGGESYELAFDFEAEGEVTLAQLAK
jgi:uncharacterized protein (TIGR03000 family)